MKLTIDRDINGARNNGLRAFHSRRRRGGGVL